jgi:hypothetical protein
VQHTRLDELDSAINAILPSLAGAGSAAPDKRQGPPRTERALDEALAESFPASDPPSWTPGIARPGPAAGAPMDGGRSTKDH